MSLSIHFTADVSEPNGKFDIKKNSKTSLWRNKLQIQFPGIFSGILLALTATLVSNFWLVNLTSITNARGAFIHSIVGFLVYLCANFGLVGI